MKTVAILAIVGVAATLFFAMNSGVSSDVESQFQAFLANHRVGYGTTDEYNFRLGVFAENLNTIAQLNEANPLATFAVNRFADRTPAEMKQRMGLNVPAHVSRKIASSVHKPVVNAADQDFKYLWASVKDQGQCGSCWAFSATAAFEARSELKNKHVDTLYAEQELVDCDTQSAGCNGGWMDNAFTYLQSHGFCQESAYKYTARDGTCAYAKNSCSVGPTDKSITDIPAGDEQALLTELANGPISVAVDANSWSFYSGGIMTSCGSSLDHGVTLVAYNSGEKSVTIRNSWAGSWGEKGYIRLAAGKNTCGYANAASVPRF
jgi:hypothetical protein